MRDEYESTRFNRFRVVKRTENVFANGLPSDGTTRPIRAIYGSGDAKPGEISDRVWQVYWDKIAADEAMDGYVDLVTSELDLSETHIIELYRKLDCDKIEDEHILHHGLPDPVQHISELCNQQEGADGNRIFQIRRSG